MPFPKQTLTASREECGCLTLRSALAPFVS